MVDVADDIECRVIALVAQQTGCSASQMSHDTQIETDLGCTGDAAEALMKWMQREFEIDMTEFRFDRHFDTEGLPGWPLALAFIVSVPISVLLMICLGNVFAAFDIHPANIVGTTGLFTIVYGACFLLVLFLATFLPNARARRMRKVPVTVRHLIEAARTKTWPHKFPEHSSS